MAGFRCHTRRCWHCRSCKATLPYLGTSNVMHMNRTQHDNKQSCWHTIARIELTQQFMLKVTLQMDLWQWTGVFLIHEEVNWFNISYKRFINWENLGNNSNIQMSKSRTHHVCAHTWQPLQPQPCAQHPGQTVNESCTKIPSFYMTKFNQHDWSKVRHPTSCITQEQH